MRIFVTASVLLLGGCVPDFEDDLSTITEPRLLAIQSEPAEAEPGDPVRMRAFVVAPDGIDPRAPRFALCLARKPLSELGPVSPACLTVEDDGSGAVQELGQGATIDAVLPDDGCRLFGPVAPPPRAGESPSRPVDPDPTGGYYQPLIAELDQDLTIGAVRLDCGVQRASREDLLSYNAQYRRNENPRLGELLLDGEPLAPEPASSAPSTVRAYSTLSLRATFAECPSEPVCGDGICGAHEDRANCEADCAVEVPKGCTGAEPYVYYDPGDFAVEPRREGLRVSWYASAGTFEAEQTGRDEGETTSDTSNTWTAPSGPGLVHLWLVIRDSRGGASWENYSVEVVP